MMLLYAMSSVNRLYQKMTIIQWRMRSDREDEDEGGSMSIGATRSRWADDVWWCRGGVDDDDDDEFDSELAMRSKWMLFITPARLPHCRKSFASSLFNQSSIQSWQCFTMLLHCIFVTFLNSSSVCDRVSVTLRPVVARCATAPFTCPHNSSIGWTNGQYGGV